MTVKHRDQRDILAGTISEQAFATEDYTPPRPCDVYI
jgi:hypothetical protein